MATKNDITGDALVSRTSEAYRNNYDAIFGKKGKNNDKRTGQNDGTMGNGSGGMDNLAEETVTAHDRLPPDSNH